MFVLLNLSTLLETLIVTFLLFILYTIFIRPLYLLRYYSKQKALVEFFPIIGGFGKRLIELPCTGDFNHKYRQILQCKNPNVKFFATNLGSKAMVILVDPALIKAFLLHQEENYVKSEQQTDIFKVLIGNGLATAEGKTWRKHRKIISTAFHFEFLKEMIPTIVQTVQELLDKLAAKDLSNVDILKEYQKITGEVFGRIFFGEQFSKYTFDGDPLTVAIDKITIPMMQESIGFWNGLLGPWFIKAGILPKHREMIRQMKRARKFFRKIIEEKKQKRLKEKENGENNGKRENLLEILIDHEETSSEDEHLTTDEIIDEFLSFSIAGTDTTGHLLTMATYNLTQNPQAYQMTLKESLNILDNEEMLCYDDVQKMDYTLGVLKETLRITAPLTFLLIRRALKDHDLKDLKVKEGTLVTFFPIHNSLKEEYFEEPNAFKPQRWIDHEKVSCKWKDEPYCYTPFSAGPRNCIGQHLALLEARIILGMFLKRFEIGIPEDYRMKMTIRLLYEPLDPLKLMLKVRS